MSAIKPIVHTADIRMNAHDHSRSSFTVPCQDWQGFPCLMRVHENQCVKWAGVAGLRARGFGVNRGFGASMLGGHGHFFGAGRARLRRGEALRFVVSCQVAKA